MEQLCSQGHRVTVLDDLSTGSEANLGKVRDRVSLTSGSIEDAALVMKTVAGCDAVLHLAAKVSVTESIKSPAHSARTNILGFLNVLEAAREHAVRLVYASSAAVYGTAERVVCRESDPDLKPSSPYGLEKLSNEWYASLYAQLHAMRALGLRYFNVYGSRQSPSSPYAGVIARFTSRATRGHTLTIFGDGRQTRDFIAVEEVARANRLALESACDGVLNIATGRSVSLLELVELLGEICDQNLPIEFVPARPGDVQHSAANVECAASAINFTSQVALRPGLERLLHSEVESPDR